MNKHRLNKLIVLVILILVSGNVSSQKGVIKKAIDKRMNQYSDTKEAMQEMELVVVLLEESDDVLKKLAVSKEKQNEYMSNIENYNTLVKKHVPQYLDFFKGIKFMKISELQLLSQDERFKYYYLVFNVTSKAAKGRGIPTDLLGSIKKGKESKFERKYKRMKFDPVRLGWTRLEMYAKEGYRSGSTYVTAVDLAKRTPTEWSLVYALATIRSTYGPKTKVPEMGQNKVLLICEDDLKKKMTKEEVAEVYKLNHKVVDRETFAKAIVERDSNYYCLVVNPLKTQTETPSFNGQPGTPAVFGYIQNYFDCQTGVIVGVVISSDYAGNVGQENCKCITTGNLRLGYNQLTTIIN